MAFLVYSSPFWMLLTWTADRVGNQVAPSAEEPAPLMGTRDRATEEEVGAPVGSLKDGALESEEASAMISTSSSAIGGSRAPAARQVLGVESLELDAGT